MLFLDVDICLHAFRPSDAPESRPTHDWLIDNLTGSTRIAVSELVLSSVVRIATNHRLFAEPAPVSAALDFCDNLLLAPATSVVRPGPRHWSIFREFVGDQRLRGNDVPDAYLAALALEHGATMVSLDRGFHRFPGLRVLNPLE